MVLVSINWSGGIISLKKSGVTGISTLSCNICGISAKVLLQSKNHGEVSSSGVISRWANPDHIIVNHSLLGIE